MLYERVRSGVDGVRALKSAISGRPVRSQCAFIPRQDVKALVMTPPPPIVDSRNKLVLLWSHKSGCTFAVKWVFSHMGVLKEALPGVHGYRVEKLYPSHQHQAAIEDFCGSPSAYRVVRFVRDPFKRAVSSYIHASVVGYEDSKISPFLGRVVDSTSRFSFREFVAYLGSIDMHQCNLHHRLQTQPLERRLILAPRFLINLDHSMESLPKLEAFLGLPQTNPKYYRESRHHTRASVNQSSPFAGDMIFNIFGQTGPAVPDYRTFYDSDLESGVYNLYAEDFLRYGFSTRLDEQC